jgi:hypothetical protein
MVEYSSSDKYLKQIKAKDIIRYLKTHDWKEIPTRNSNTTKYKSPSPISDNGTYLELLVPLNEKYKDYSHVIELIIENISIFEARSFEEALSQILILADRLKTGILEARKGMIPLNQGISLYKGLQDLIIYSACSEFERIPAKRYPRKLGDAIKYAETSLLGQSELGSYVANIYLPLPRPALEYPWNTNIEPFPRKVVLRILRGLEDLASSVNENSSDPIVDNYEKGLNSNMCDALINIIDVGMGNEVVVKSILEPVYSFPDGILTEFILNPSNKYYLAEARDILMENAPIEEEGVFYGYPEILKHPQEKAKGTIKLKCINIVPKRTVTITMELNPSDYQRVIEAHRSDRDIKIKGVLDRIKGRYYLKDPQELEVLEEDSEEPWYALGKF